MDANADLAQGVALSVDLNLRQGQMTVTPRGARPFSYQVDAQRLEDARTKTREALTALVGLVGATLELPSWTALDAGLRGLASASVDAATKLVADPDDRAEFLSESARALRLAHAGGIPLIEVRTTLEGLFPFELLTIEQEVLEPIQSDAALMSACERFWGFSAGVRRWLKNGHVGLSQDRRLAGGPVPAGLFVSARTRAAKRAVSDFARATELLHADGPWPSDEMTKDATSAADEAVVKRVTSLVAERVYDPRLRPGTDPSPVPDQIQHFACHCITEGHSDNWALEVQSETGPPIPIRLHALDKGLGDAARKANRRRTFPRPVVFLNACGSGTIHHTGSFCRLFLSNGNRAVIGTETLVPDQFAAEFASHFYDRLVRRGETAGTALVNAKRAMLLGYRNPLGLLYSLYGEPDLRAVPERSQP